MNPTSSLHELTKAVNLSGFFVEKVSHKNQTMKLFLQRRFRSARCSRCGRYGSDFYDSTCRVFRDLPWAHTAVELHLRRVRLSCSFCQAVVVESLPFAAPSCSLSKRFLRSIGLMCQFMTRKDVALLFDVCEDTVDRAEQVLARQLQKERRAQLPKTRILRFDEIARKKGHSYLTVFVNHETSDVIGVEKGRRSQDLQPFFEELGPNTCEKIEAVSIDMSPAYQKAVRENLPNAAIVFDRFHVVKHINDALNRLRISQKAKASSEETPLWHDSKHILGKNKQDLSKEQRRLLKRLKRHSPVIAAAYEMKETFRTLWDKQTLRGAKIFLTKWIQRARKLEGTPFQGFIEMVERHREGILNWYLYPVSNGPQEGLNNKLSVLRRRAYGFRCMRRYSLKIFTATRPYVHPFLSAKT